MQSSKNIALIVVFSVFSVILMQNAYPQAPKNDFGIDQLLVRVQLKENESIEKSIKIANNGLNDIEIDAFIDGLDSIAALDKSSVKLMRGYSGSVSLKIIGAEKGAYIGKLALSSAREKKEVPIIVEVESKEVLADVSANPSTSGKVYPDSLLSVDVGLINLMGAESANISVSYEIKDFNNNRILEESENIAVSKRASFIKTFKIPNNAKITSYVLAIKAGYKESLGTTTLVFYLEKKDVLNISGTIPMIIALTALVSLMLLALLLKTSFRRKAVSPRKMEKIAAKKAEMQKKLDSLVEAYQSGFISKEAFEKSRRKLRKLMKDLNK